MISSEETSQLNQMFEYQLLVLKKKRKVLLMKKNAHMRSGTEDVHGFEDQQEFIIEKGSTENMHDQEFLLDVLLPVHQSGETQSQLVQESRRGLVQEQQNLFTQTIIVPRHHVEEIELELGRDART